MIPKIEMIMMQVPQRVKMVIRCNKDKDGGEPKKRPRDDQGVQEARILQPKPWRMPTRFNLQKAIEEQKMRKAIAAGLCKCPIETQRG